MPVLRTMLALIRSDSNIYNTLYSSSCKWEVYTCVHYKSVAISIYQSVQVISEEPNEILLGTDLVQHL